MSYPILYSATEMNFDHNGIGILSACVSCEVTEEANGIFELAMQYPMDGVHFAEIGDRSIIKAKADQFRGDQLFRVYAISKPMSGIVTVLAEHISYDLSGIPVTPFSANNVPSALLGLKGNAVVDCLFDFWTDKTTEAKFNVPTPASIRSRLGGVAGSLLDVYGGEYEFDNFTVKLHNNRGQNRGVSIRYGKNLTDIKQEQNCASVATGIYPYWAGDVDGNTVLVQLPERIVSAPGTYNFVKIRTVDFTQSFETQPTVEQLRAKTESYIRANNIGVPYVSMTVSFAQLEQSEEYKNLKLLERVSLFDTVNVEFPALGVSATAKVIKLVYDSIAERVYKVDIGSVRANISDTIVEQQQQIQQKPTRTDLEKAKEESTKWLTNGKGYAYFRKDDLGNIVDLLFMDEPNPETAVNVMRVGQSGIGFSKSGVNGRYESAWTIDGKFNADFIYGGTISGVYIVGDYGEIGGLSMSENELTAKYRKDFGPFTEEDLQKIQDLYFSGAEPTKEEMEKYDINMDGRIGADDALVMNQMINGSIPSFTEGVITVSSNDPKNCITLEVTDGYRKGQKCVIGMGNFYSDSVSAKQYYSGDSKGYTGTVSVGNGSLTVSGGIITGIEVQ